MRVAAEVKERPILFNGEMVRAILDGRKSQTRRVMKPQPPDEYGTILVETYHPTKWDRHGDGYPGEPVFGATTEDGEHGWRCPYGAPGDRLWVRETWCQAWDMERDRWFDPPKAHYRADGEAVVHVDDMERSPWKPSIHMPRWASRLTLEVTDVRVERVQEITEGDAIAEGVQAMPSAPAALTNRTAFGKLWDMINAKRGFPWDANPWVWVVSFRGIDR